ncbi:MAG: hypothetical protein ACI86H_002871, partial [bacterium]
MSKNLKYFVTTVLIGISFLISTFFVASTQYYGIILFLLIFFIFPISFRFLSDYFLIKTVLQNSAQVKVNEKSIIYSKDGKQSIILWDDLNKVSILTTTDGTSIPSVFWILEGVDTKYSIPLGSEGEHILLDHLQ